MQQFLACVFLARTNLNFLQRAILVERYGCVEQEIAVEDSVHTSV